MSEQLNIPYENLTEKNLMNPNELSCIYCFDLRLDNKMILSRLIFSKCFLDFLQIDVQEYSLSLINFGIKEYYTYFSFIQI